MNRMHRVTDTIFAASVLCQTKAHLLNKGETGYPDELSRLERYMSEKYKQRVREILEGNNPHHSNTTTILLLKKRYRLVLDPLLCSKGIVSKPDALLYVAKGVQSGTYSPVRLQWSDKITNSDRLTLAFDAIALSCARNIPVSTGTIIHGAQYTLSTVPLTNWLPRAQSHLKQLVTTLENPQTPLPVLNKHCPACEFRDRCRAIAIEQDDLSLLGNIRPKDRQKLISKGIFTVTQLSYTYRPRRRSRTNRPAPRKHDPALKALAVRKGIVHVLDDPEFAIRRAHTVYVDVEGVSSADFYYLVGVRFNDGHHDIQHAFWADTPNEESELWTSFIRVLKSIDSPQIVHYGSYETLFFKRMMERYPTNDETVTQLLSSAINLLAFTYAQVHFPTFTNSLKDIARHLGFKWSAQNATGRSALYWRLKWEETKDPTLKEKLLTYNADDCKALEITALTIAKLCSGPQVGTESSYVDVGTLEGDRPWRFGPLEYAVPEFKQINEAAYWHYQRTKIYVRLKSLVRSERRRAARRPPINKLIHPELNRPDACPRCSSGKMYRRGIYSHLIYDIRVTAGGARRWVVRQRFYRYQCYKCKNGLNALPRQERFGAGLRAYVVFCIIELRIAQRAVSRMMDTLFGIPIMPSSVNRIKIVETHHYEETYKDILRQIVAGQLVHADETQVRVKKGQTHYVWVFTNLEQVAYVYSETRNASTVRGILTDFKGVLVTDFYTGYDSVECAQQKCLIHLLRDINEDLLKAPFNLEISQLANSFGKLLKPIIETVDRFGLRACRLRKHRGAVESFYESLANREYETDEAAAYKRRFEKNRDKLFTFLDYDGVPWNNNNAEHAIKAFARLRNVIGANATPKGIHEYLVLLSIAQTCKYRGTNFFEFLRSGHVDIGSFERGGHPVRTLLLESHPKE